MQQITFTVAQRDWQLLRSTIAGLIDTAPNTAAYIVRKVNLEMEARTITMPLAITMPDLVAA